MSTTYNKPLPRLDTLNKPFWEAARQKRLVLQYCSECGDTRFPPAPVCPQCLSLEQNWKDASGRGTLQSWVEFHRAYWDGYRDDLPYQVCLVQLEEGPLLVSNLVGDPSKARLGAPVHVVFDAVTDAFTLPKFALD